MFIRFAGCNISCKYCDTTENLTSNGGTEYSYNKLNEKIQLLQTPDMHSIEVTGGEPLLHADYIKNFLSEYSYNAMLETNATIPENMEKLLDIIDMVSMDIKLPEHFDSKDYWFDIYNKELSTIKLLENASVNYYIKIVVSQDTSKDLIQKIRDDLYNISSDTVNIILQPVSPMSLWTNKSHLFILSEVIGEKFSVSVIPQIHKYLDVQ